MPQKKRTATEIYNKLGRISGELDSINGEAFTPSHVYSESMRVFEDIDAILRHLGIVDNTVPPRKPKNATPKESYTIALELLNTIKTMEAGVGVTSADFYAFERTEVTPSNVYEIVQIILSELQVIKAFIGLNHEITRGAKYYTDKVPSDIAQLLGWLQKKVNLINSLRVKEER